MIPVTCGCGKVMQVPDTYAARRIRCPACGATLTVPHPDDPRTVFEVDAEPPVPSGWRFPDFSIARILLGPIALISGLLAFAGTFGPGVGSHSEAVGTIWLIFTVALAGLAASRPRR